MDKVHSQLLQVIGAVIFGVELPAIDDSELESLLKESEAQAVYPLVVNTLEGRIQKSYSAEKYAAFGEKALMHGIMNTRSFAEHGELHELMTADGIPYVVMKGLASAMYYPEPSLRNMGDVDFLVKSEDIKRAGEVMEQAGFVIDHGDDDDGFHIAYHRPPASIWELHRNVNGVPSGEVGKIIQAEINRTIETAVEVECEEAVCRVPDKFHHGLIMLLHTASHLTSEGVGLRHLCDWVVFASSMSDADFRSTFEKKLKDFGLWRFAQALTLLGIRYLHAPKRVWALQAIEEKKLSDEILEGLMNDILSGGNFGTKDMNRYREIKYISGGEKTINDNGVAAQAIHSLNAKVYANHKLIKIAKVLLPVGWVIEGAKYARLLVTGKRKASSTNKMFKEATERKQVYSALRLFK